MSPYIPKFLRNTVRIQYASNFRLFQGITKPEPFQKYLLPVASNLVLNGNIGHVKSPGLHAVLDKVSKSFDHVYWIPGALELTDEKNTGVECLDAMRELAQKYNIYVGTKLERSILDSQITTLSTTGWGEITEKDYHILWTNPNNNLKDKIRLDMLRCLRADEENWIRRQINRSYNKICLFTHHDVSSMMRKTDEYESMVAHIHGQGPNQCFVTKSNTLVTCNNFQLPNYNNAAFIEIPSTFIQSPSAYRLNPIAYSLAQYHVRGEWNLLQ